MTLINVQTLKEDEIIQSENTFKLNMNKIDQSDLNNFKNGNVLWLYVKNFKTFEEQQFYFGSKLNLIAAPNGVGKSTVAAALAFIFGGDTKQTLNISNLKDLINFNCTEACVEAVVYYENINDITQTLNLNNDNKKVKLSNINLCRLKKTLKVYQNSKKVQESFFINNTPYTLLHYNEYILKNLHVDVNKMTNFLAQEKVSEFVKLKPEKLFEHVFFDYLIEHKGKKRVMSDMLSDYKTMIKGKEQLLINLSEANKREDLLTHKQNKLMQEVEKFNEIEKYERDIMILEYKNDYMRKKETEQEMESKTSVMKVIQKEYKENKKEIKEERTRMELLTNSDIHLIGERNIKQLSKENLMIKQTKSSILNILNEMESIKEDIKKNEKENERISEENRKIERTKESNIRRVEDIYRKYLESFNLKDSNNIIELLKVEEIKHALTNQNSNLNIQIEKQHHDILKNLSNKSTSSKTPKILQMLQSKGREYQTQVEKIQQYLMQVKDKKGRRMELLRKYHEDTYNAIMFLKTRSDLNTLYVEPLFLNIDIKSNYETEVEALLSFQALSSFLVFNSQDMLKLSKILKDEKRWGVNFIVVDNNNYNDSNIKIKNENGICAASDCVIFNNPTYETFLNNFYNFNRIPIVKNKQINENDIFKKYPSVKKMVINNYIVESKGNKYNSDKIIKHDRIRINNSLFVNNSNSIATNEEIAAKIKRLNKLNQLREEVKNDIMLQLFKQKEEEKEIQKEQHIKDNITKIFYGVKRALSDYFMISKRELFHIDYSVIDQKKMYVGEIIKNINKVPLTQMDYGLINSNITEISNCQRKITHLEQIQYRKKDQLDQKIEEVNQLSKKSKEYQEKLQNIEMAYESEVRNKKKQKAFKNNLMSASEILSKSISQNQEEKMFYEINDEMNWRVEIENYAQETSHDIMTQVKYLQNKIRAIGGDLDVSAKHHFTKVQKGKEQANTDKLNLQKQFKETVKKIQSIKECIECGVHTTLERINKRFGEMFKDCGKRGEVRLNTMNSLNGNNTENEIDAQFMLNIWVSFKCGSESEEDKTNLNNIQDELIQLSSTRHSGGEKSLSTILFLLSLQEENSSFRLVDEINQGMDEKNEKNVFKVLNKMEGQFFIITPKLLQSFDYPENTKAHVMYCY